MCLRSSACRAAAFTSDSGALLPLYPGGAVAGTSGCARLSFSMSLVESDPISRWCVFLCVCS